MCTSRPNWRLILVSVLLLGIMAGCESSNKKSEKREVSVFAASSLTEGFGELKREFEGMHPDVEIRLTFAGSQVLRLQIEAGAPADIFASANKNHMQALVDGGQIPEAQIFAENELIIITPLDNPAGIMDFSGLGEASRIVIGTENVPVGIYTREFFERAGAEFGEEFAANLRGRVVSEESNVRLVRAKVELGEADAAIVYRTDGSSSDNVHIVSIPEELNVRASYPIGALQHAQNSPEVEEFIEYILSAAGQKVLARHGFVMEEK